jgi:NADH dehydrogenase FAD-containing subunit
MVKMIVIIGGGFAGVYCARYLEHYLPAEWKILLFSQENHLTFTPMALEPQGGNA